MKHLFYSFLLAFIGLATLPALAQNTGINKVPQKALDVHGDIRGDSSLTIGPEGDSNGDSSLYFNNGKLGIGTTSPTGQFEVVGIGTVLGSPDNQATGGTASASSSDLPRYGADEAFDGDLATNWRSSNPTGWLQYDLGVAKLINEYRVESGGLPSEVPEAWNFQGSSDGNNWTTLDTQSSQSFTNNVFNSYPFSNSTSYRYYRIDVTAAYSGSNFHIGELQLITNGYYVQNQEALKVDSGRITISGKYTLPVVDGSANQIISTDGSGNLSWKTPIDNITTDTSHWDKTGTNLSYTTGNVGIGTAAATSNSQLKVDHSGTGWIAGNFGNDTSGTNRVVMGNLNGEAVVGGHNADLNAWATLSLNPGGSVKIPLLGGSGDQMVVTDNNGTLSSQAIPVNTDNQTLSISGQTLSISGAAGSSVTLPESSHWDRSGNNISYEVGNVGIGTDNPQGQFSVFSREVISSSNTDQTGSGTASASCDGFSGSHPATSAFDNNHLTGWISCYNPSNVAWLQYDFGNSQQKVINKYRMRLYGTSSENDPRVWDFQGSNNGSTWTTLDSQVFDQYFSTYTWVDFPIYNEVGYRYYRFYITAPQSNTDRYVLTEVELITNTYSYTEDFKVDNGEVTISGEYTLPATDGSAGQMMTTDGNDNVSWTTISVSPGQNL